MSKYLIRIAGGVTTFALGVAAVLALGILGGRQVGVNGSDTSGSDRQGFVATGEGRPEVRFKGFAESPEGLLAEFEIVNYSAEGLSYTSNVENAPFHYVKFDGKEDFNWYCGMGAREWVIPSGSSIIVKISALNFRPHLAENGDFSVGFAVGEGKLWSDGFSLPDNVRERIKADWERARN